MVQEQYGKTLTDAETEELFEKLRADGALSEAELEDVTAGAWQDRCAILKVIEHMLERQKKNG